MKTLKDLLGVNEISEIFKDNKKFGLIFALVALIGGLLVVIELKVGPVFWFLISLALLGLFCGWLFFQIYDIDAKKPKKLGLYEAIFSLVFLLIISLNSSFFAVISLIIVSISAIAHFSADKL